MKARRFFSLTLDQLELIVNERGDVVNNKQNADEIENVVSIPQQCHNMWFLESVKQKWGSGEKSIGYIMRWNGCKLNNNNYPNNQ